jgi:hypothetical protein
MSAAYFPDDAWARPVRPSQHRDSVPATTTFAHAMAREQRRKQRDLAAATPVAPRDATRPLGAAARHVLTPTDAWQRDRDLRASALAQLHDYTQLWSQR